MCLAIPGKIISIDSNDPELMMAKVSFGGVIKQICVSWVPDAQIGDYVLAHVGFAISKIDEEEANKTLELLKSMGELD
ncbi:MAG: HypC/HybG/HupF family hydrogenase formation chaperone [Bacteroidetes bacterium]|nr:HypC/HybG/HupF family hydrogenase formation chaperone [Bacteroidota bacterium]MCA0447711.1 HypC/HybG/HupF family hydrogenase formation chaperone [Bacteroidota bacterium]